MNAVETAVPARASARVNPPLLPRLQRRFEQVFLEHWNTQWGGKCILHGREPGPNAVRLDGNDYLGVSGHPDIVRAQTAVLRRGQDSVIQSGVFLLDSNPVRQLEQSLAAWVGKEDGFICQSGYVANVGLIQAVADAETPVYLDTLAHTSLWEGAHAARAPAHAFRHNDAVHLARVIERHGPGLVIVDSVYSTTGALCPLAEMVEVAERQGCMILVDESHSLGTHGPRGAGLCAQLGVTDRVHFISASLAKALAGRAGFFSAPAKLRYHILTSSFPNIFSSCVLPHEAVGLGATVDVLQQADAARATLQRHTRRMRQSLTDMGYPIHQGTEQIIALEAGLEPATIRLRDELDARGVHTAFFGAPATSRNRSLARMTLHAALTEAELSHVEAAAQEVAALVKPWDWPVARRNRGATQLS